MSNIDPFTPSLRHPSRESGRFFSLLLDAADADEVVRTKGGRTTEARLRIGVQLLFKIFGLEAERPDEFYTFVESGGLDELYREYRRLRKTSIGGDCRRPSNDICSTFSNESGRH